MQMVEIEKIVNIAKDTDNSRVTRKHAINLAKALFSQEMGQILHGVPAKIGYGKEGELTKQENELLNYQSRTVECVKLVRNRLGLRLYESKQIADRNRF